MRRIRYVPTTLLLIGVAASCAVGCDIFKPKETDAGANTSAVTPDTLDAAPANPAAPQPVTPAAPLNPAAPHPTPTATTKTDGGGGAVAATDAGKTDGAAPTPAPLPTFPGFDAGALQGFDAGGLFRVPDGGFKPPPWPK